MVISESSHKHIADELFGTYSMPPGTISAWQIGPMELVIESRAQEWRLHWDYNQEPLSDRFGFNPKHEESYEHMNTERMAYSHKSDTLTIKPQLADRPIVIRPEISFYVPPKEEIKLFLTTPLWLSLKSGESIIREIPSFRLTDTWFGPMDDRGEYCYAAKISARLDVHELKMLYHRAITSIVIKNRASDALLLERIKLPIPHLSLYRGEDGMNYTEEIIVEREKSGKTVQINLGKRPDKDFPLSHKLIGPRKHLESSFVSRTLSSIFSAGDH